MTQHFLLYRSLLTLVCSLMITSCYSPPFNDFKKTPLDIGIYRNSKKHLVEQLQHQDIQFVAYGDTMTLLIPTDHYFVKNTAEINEICYAGIENVAKLLKLYPKSRIFIAGFNDDIGSPRYQKRLTQSRAEAVLTFLWANGIAAHLLKADGYGDRFPIGNNHYIHASAFNRRIEIQWTALPHSESQIKAEAYHGMK